MASPAELIAELTAAVEDELAEVRASERSRRVPVSGGRSLGQSGSDWLYSFALHYPVTLPDDVPLRIELASGDTYTGQLIAASAFEVTLACAAKLPDRLGSASLTLDASFLLEELIGRLSELEPDQCELPLRLFGFDPPRSLPSAPGPDDGTANEFQLQAVAAVLERDVVYVWGPPGTGKTTTLGLLAEALARRGLRVLAVASTNVAVDNAVLSAGQRLAGALPVVRFGTPQLPALREPAAALPAARGSLLATMPLFPELTAPAPEPQAPSQAVVVVPARRSSDGREEAARHRALREARIVGVTLSRVALTPELRTPGFDAVLIDEASAAPLPAVFLAASLASTRVVALGDPRQLPPVATSNGPLARRWLQRDVFAQAGLEDDDPRAVLLREQYRMPPPISRLANELVYGGRLVDAPGLSRRSGGARLLDTTSEGGHCERQDGSRLNRVHAELAVETARDLLAGGPSPAAQVAIITPYRAQARLIWRLLREARLDRSVDVGTVHRFQGLERHAIVFDTVEAPPEKPAPFVSGGYGSEAMRLVNVAITRAQSELVVIANSAHLMRTLRRGSTLLGLLALLTGEEL